MLPLLKRLPLRKAESSQPERVPAEAGRRNPPQGGKKLDRQPPLDVPIPSERMMRGLSRPIQPSTLDHTVISTLSSAVDSPR
jgi:hypothetical protein